MRTFNPLTIDANIAPHFFASDDTRVLLAPMEGVFDSLVHELLTEVNDYDLCITEFIRVVDQLLPIKVFHHVYPELQNTNRTLFGMLVHVQLLGQSLQWLAENAARAVELGSWDVNLNCGCPSKAVNDNGGGATLPKDPKLIYQGTKAMREAVPTYLPVSVKVRLGWDSGEKKFEIADAVQQAGATELVVHGRAKKQGYHAEHIDWRAIDDIRQRLNIPVIANSGIWDWQSVQQYMAIGDCDVVMVSCGALNTPNLSRVVKYNEPRIPWPEMVALLQKYTRLEKQGDTGLCHVARIKQWLSYLCKEYDEATELSRHVRVLSNSSDIAGAIQAIDIEKL